MKWGGLNNVQDPAAFGDRALAEADNVDLDDTEKILSRRKGHVNKLAGNYHSLYACREGMFVGKDLAMGRIDISSVGDLSYTEIKPGLSGDRITYQSLLGAVYFSENTYSGVLRDGTLMKWGMDWPPLTALSEGSGGLTEGVYQVALTYVAYDGRESGTGVAVPIQVSSNAGILFPSLPVSADEQVVSKNIYISTTNGEKLYLAMTLPNSQTTTAWRGGVLGRPLSTQFKHPAPPGSIVKEFNGRLLVASENMLYASEPFQYDLFNISKSYIPFDGNIRMVEPVNNGVYISTTDKVSFLSGMDFMELIQKEVSEYPAQGGGSIPSDALKMKNVIGDVAVWVSEQGCLLGLPGGEVYNVTQTSVKFPSARSGILVQKNNRGYPQIIVSLKDVSGGGNSFEPEDKITRQYE